MTRLKSKMIATVAIGLMMATSALAQDNVTDVAPSATVPTSSEALVAAARLVDLLMPPTQRETMMTAIVGAQIQNVFAGLMNQPRIKEAMEREPAARPVFDRFMARQQALAVADLRENLPGLAVAMTDVYARRFTLSQLADMTAFFTTPTGQFYVEQSLTIMSDPAVTAWQTRAVTGGLARMPDELARLQQDLEAAGVRSDRNGN